MIILLSFIFLIVPKNTLAATPAEQALIDSFKKAKYGNLLKPGEPFVLVKPANQGAPVLDKSGKVLVAFIPREQAYPAGTLNCATITFQDSIEVNRKPYTVTNGVSTAKPFSYDATPKAGDTKTHNYSFRTVCKDSKGVQTQSVMSEPVSVKPDKTVINPTTGTIPVVNIVDPTNTGNGESCAEKFCTAVKWYNKLSIDPNIRNTICQMQCAVLNWFSDLIKYVIDNILVKTIM